MEYFAKIRWNDPKHDLSLKKNLLNYQKIILCNISEPFKLISACFWHSQSPKKSIFKWLYLKNGMEFLHEVKRSIFSEFQAIFQVFRRNSITYNNAFSTIVEYVYNEQQRNWKQWFENEYMVIVNYW